MSTELELITTTTVVVSGQWQVDSGQLTAQVCGGIKFRSTAVVEGAGKPSKRQSKQAWPQRKQSPNCETIDLTNARRL
ncbi:Serine hydroxymethyltransferase [Trichinella spiralis]|uniref:Serine hydroxymethyltransferase n=1 Tax=Trichinella spiralis TaxID=6334 RepID=A0ABR3K908_TRISP